MANVNPLIGIKKGESVKTRIIQTKFWMDDFVSSLTSLEKLIFNYYLTNDKVNIIHCYECPDTYVLVATGVSRGVLEGCKQKLSSANKVKFYKGYVHLVNADRYEKYTGGDNDTAKEKLLSEMSSDVLDWYNNKTETPVERGVYRSGIPLPINKKQEISNNKLEIGVVKGVEENDMIDIAEKYQVPLAFVKSKYDDMVLWAGQRPNNPKLRGRNWKLTLMNWVKRDAMDIMAKNKPRIAVMPTGGATNE